MAETAHLELCGSGSSDELVEYLARRGLSATASDALDRLELEVAFSGSPEERLQNEVRSALRGWVAGHDPGLVLSEAGDGRFVLRPAAE